MSFDRKENPATTAQTRGMTLTLKRADGTDWRLAGSAGMERFIGFYPLIEDICPRGELLRFNRA